MEKFNSLGKNKYTFSKWNVQIFRNLTALLEVITAVISLNNSSRMLKSNTINSNNGEDFVNFMLNFEKMHVINKDIDYSDQW